MSNTHDIDNEVHLFHFEHYGGRPSFSGTPAPPDLSAATVPSHDDPPTSEELGEQAVEVVKKGKGVTKPMPIRAPMAVVHDIFDMTHSTAGPPSTSRQSLPPPPLASSSSKPYSPLFDDNPQDFYPETGDLLSASESGVDQWKGKGKEHPPILPPLAFSPTELDFSQASSPSLAFMSPSSGPSSYGSNYGLSTTRSTTNNEPETRDSAGSLVPLTIPPRPLTPSDTNRPVVKHMPSRSRSMSNLSVHSTRSPAARSMSRIKLKFSRPNTPSNLTWKLLSKKAADAKDELSSSTNVNQSPVADGANARMNGSLPQWRTGFQVDELDFTIAQLSSTRLLDADSRSSDATCYYPSPLKHKGRSKSSPFPLSALDYVPATSTDIFAPIPVATRNYFDELLPQELRIQVLGSLVALHELDHLRAIKEARWTMAKASSSRSKWVGKDKGIRELVRLSRVSSSFIASLSPT